VNEVCVAGGVPVSRAVVFDADGGVVVPTHGGDGIATIVGMTRVASRELRNDTAGVLRRAAAGEQIEITVNGEAVAQLAPLTARRSQWTSKAEFLARLFRIQADPGLADELARLDADTEDLGPIA